MATITINGQDIQIGDQERLNVIEAASRMDVDIPYYCWHPALSVVANCRMCEIEVGGNRWSIANVSRDPALTYYDLHGRLG